MQCPVESHAQRWFWLSKGYTKRHPRARGEDRRGQILDIVSIHDRPPEIDERPVLGHWEVDLLKVLTTVRLSGLW
jgi:IS30 family transposase